MTKPDDNLTEQEAANYLRTSVRVLRAVRRASDGPPFARIGRRIIYRLADLQKWQLAQTNGQNR